MFDKKDIMLLEFALLMIDEAEQVIERHESVYEALNDFEGKNAILLNLLQIGEKLNKITSELIREKIPIQEIYSIRNRITHDYGGVDLYLIESILIDEIPKLKLTIEELIK